MTTKPKTSRFRIKRSPSATEDKPRPTTAAKPAAPKQPIDSPFGGPPDDGFGETAFPGSAKAETDKSTRDTEIAEIRKEGLTGRQLRIAKRLAQKHGLDAKTEFDAVRALRARGVDPFKRESMLELVVPEASVTANETTSLTRTDDKPDDEQRIRLPQTVDPDSRMPAAPISPMAARAQEVQDMQRDIARRRRRRMGFLFARLTFFVLLPTLIAGYYYFAVATPLYATKSSLRIDQANAPAAGGGLGSVLGGMGLATSQDAVGVQDYLSSMEAMLRLEDEDIGFRRHFMGDDIDIVQRLPEDASNEDAYKVYKRLVKIGYDPTEGVIRLEVSAPDPQLAVAFSGRLITYAEEQADSLTQQIREDQMQGANDSLADAESKMKEAQATVLALQEELGVLDPASETASLMSQITSFETQLAEKQLQLQQLLDNQAPNAARVAGVEGDIARLEALIETLRAQMTDASGTERSLARITGELSMAEVDLETRTMMMQEALRQVETARVEANRQVTYLTPIVNPVLPQEASYPRAFENTLLAFLILSGIYLLASITISILREQA
jgi:capsular polysaccharide transport system permease protein